MQFTKAILATYTGRDRDTQSRQSLGDSLGREVTPAKSQYKTRYIYLWVAKHKRWFKKKSGTFFKESKVNNLHSKQAGVLTLCVPMKVPIKFDTVKSGWSIVYIEGFQMLFIFISFS